MTRSIRALLGAVGCLALLAVAGSTRADDWPQFRRDAERTGASTDPISLPLTELWSWENVPTDSRTPTRNFPAIWRGRVFFTMGAKRRVLVAADARTGQPLWQQPLTDSDLHGPGPPHLWLGPTVAENGVVFVYDRVLLPETFVSTTRHVLGDIDRAPPSHRHERTSVKTELNVFICVRGFSALDGRELVSCVFPRYSTLLPGPSHLREIDSDRQSAQWRRWNDRVLWNSSSVRGGPGLPQEPVVNRMFLLHNAAGYERRPELGWDNWEVRRAFGPPLLIGNRLLALGPDSFLFDWTAGSPV
jgi:hypothetical protein